MIHARQADFARAQAAAFQLTKRYGFQHPSRIPVEDIAMDRGAVVAPGGLEGSEARLIRKGGRGIIRVRAEMKELGRRRFSIAHELGHWELHTITQWFACSAANLRDYKRSPEEAEANTFAAELLMPTYLLRDRCEKEMPSLELVKSITDECCVSLTAAGIRLLHFTKQECILVASKGRKIAWWVPKTERFGVWLRKDQPLSEMSLAWHAFAGTVTSDEVDEVPTDAWFPDRHNGVEFAVSEQSMRLGGYDTVLTLLTIGDTEN